MTYAEKIELAGIEVMNCKTQKEFLHEMQNYTNYHGKEYCSETKYMNTSSDSYYDSIAGGSVDDDVCINIWYTDGTEYSYYPALGIQGKFKKTGIKSAIIQDGYGFLTYNYDLCEEWENIRETLTEEEENAIKNGISLETLRIHKALKAEEQATEPAEETAKNTEISAEEETEEITEEPETEEQEATPAEETAKNTENSAFRYKINILEMLKKSGYTSTRIRKEKIFAQVTLQKFRTGDTNISLQTVADICNLTGLQPWDILGFSGKAVKEPETEEQETTPEEETAKNTEISAEEKTEEVTEEPEAEEQATEPAEETAKNTEISAEEKTEEVTEEPEAEEQETINFEIPKNIENEEIEKLDLMVRTYNALKRAEINKISDLKKIKTMSEFKQKVGNENRLTEIKNQISAISENNVEKETEEITEKFLNSILIDVETEIAKLPDLFKTGSEKQIAWAENIRRDAYMYLNNIITNAVILGYDVENRKPIYIDSERYKNGTECNIDGNHYNSKKIIDSVMQVKQGVLDKYFMEMCQTAPKIIENRYRIENKELRRYTTNCYKHM